MAATDPSGELGPIPSHDFSTAVMLRMVAAAERTSQCLQQLTALAEHSRECSERSEKILAHLVDKMDEHDLVVKGAVEAQKQTNEYIMAALTPWYVRLWTDFKVNPIPFILVLLMLIVSVLLLFGQVDLSGRVGDVDVKSRTVPLTTPPRAP